MLAFLRCHGLHACSVDFLMFPKVYRVSLVDVVLSDDPSCSTSSPGGNLFDGLPPAANWPIQIYGLATFGLSVLRILLSDCAGALHAVL